MSAASTIVDGTKFEIGAPLLSFSEPKANPRGGKVVNLYRVGTKQALTVQTPVQTTWGAQEGKDSDGNATGKWSISLQFPDDKYPNPEASKFLEYLKEVEKQIKQNACIHSVDWFGKKITSQEVVDEKFNTMLKYPKLEKGKAALNYNRPPALTVKLPFYEKSGWNFEVFDEDLNPLFVLDDNKRNISPLEHLTGNGKARILNSKCLLQPTVWITNNIPTITWNLKQILIKTQKSDALPTGVCLLALTDTDKTNLVSEVESEHLEPIEEVPKKVDATTLSATVDSDSDSSDEESEEVVLTVPIVKEPEPEPKKVVTKKVITKKT
jgi:hypothetical protein